ncbi:aspartate carbamoyltransferase catalytic subunit [Lacticaseibacillus mingshuiensis]|uniref:Aspartate carbamoyltransferase n=1 Tax=Lacticaseibacillus mingshuiensis TaxID=2799574 RepID=A0ABW4CFN0_9LACO|nr:aspartate carbamoyltransferase catalytic subunit [Lacticaseibacillus mingshuiensis]
MPNTIEHFVAADQVTTELAGQLIDRAEAFKNGAIANIDLPTYAANLFFEASTRTHTSFEMAERKLGMTVLPFDPAHSSVTKGETLGDTLRTLAAIGVQVAVIRHPEDNYYKPLIEAGLPLHLINAGDGAGQHPSQMMLDLMTIHEAFGHFKGLKVGIVGDLAHSRVARSDMQILTKLGASVAFSGPKAWYTDDFKAYGPYVPLKDLAPAVDVLMLLRVQLERLSDAEKAEFSAATYHARFGVTQSIYDSMQPRAIIMHPAPVNRDVELASNLVQANRSRIFDQMQNGVFMRMAMLELVCHSPLTDKGDFPHANADSKR